MSWKVFNTFRIDLKLYLNNYCESMKLMFVFGKVAITIVARWMSSFCIIKPERIQYVDFLAYSAF